MTTATTPTKRRTEKTTAERSSEAINAEVEKLLAEAEDARASAREHDANVATQLLEQEKTKHLIESARIESACAALTLQELERTESFRRVNDLFYHKKTYHFDTIVTEKSVRACLATLVAWARSEPGCEITLNLSTDGGSIIDGLHLIDGILAIRRDGCKVNTVALGMCASMGVPILSAGETRYMGKYATLLLHEGSLGAVGTRGEVEDTVALSDKLSQRCFELMAERAMPLNKATTVAFLKKFVKRRDISLTSQEALSLGLVDEIL